MNDIVHRLVERLGEEVLLHGEALAGYRVGYPIPQPVQARALVRPGTTEEVAAVLRLCHEAGQPVVPLGGGTNLVQGTATGEQEILLSLERMNRVEEVDAIGRTMTVQAGATLHQVQAAAAEAGLMFALDFGAREFCTIGGNVATNAGGGRVLRYGMTREQVLGIEAVLADGRILSSLNRVIKNNTGYDLKHLFIGSEGTLGVVTRVVLRLWEPPAAHATALVAAREFDQVAGLLAYLGQALGGTLTSFEVMWENYYETIVSALVPDRPPLPRGQGYYVLLEAPLLDRAEDEARFARVMAEGAARGLFELSTVAASEEEREALWAIRYGSEQIDYRYAPIFNFDVSLAIREMELYLVRVREALHEAFGEVECWIFGHIGDGNLHLMIWGEQCGEAARHRVEEIVYTTLRSFGGSISAEHGIGLEKRDYLHLSRSSEELAVMRQIKAALDPKGILNPGKILPDL